MEVVANYLPSEAVSLVVEEIRANEDWLEDEIVPFRESTLWLSRIGHDLALKSGWPDPVSLVVERSIYGAYDDVPPEFYQPWMRGVFLLPLGVDAVVTCHDDASTVAQSLGVHARVMCHPSTVVPSGGVVRLTYPPATPIQLEAEGGTGYFATYLYYPAW